MKKVNLDSEAEDNRAFLLSLTVDPEGTVVESNGKPVACIVPLPTSNGDSEEEWSEAKNARRWELIEKKHKHGPLTPLEIAELAELQESMRRFRRQVAPLPLEDAERLHQELLDKATQSNDSP